MTTFRLSATLGLFAALAACAGAAPPAPPADAAPAWTADIFKAKAHGYAGYRIPALVAAKDGTLLAFAEGRKNSLADHGDIDLVVADSKDGGKTWSEPRVIADMGKDYIGNPAAVVDTRDGAITVLLTWKVDGAQEGAIRAGKQPATAIWSVRSTDNGKTFSKPVAQAALNAELQKRGWRWNIPGPGHAVQLAHGAHAGRLVCAANHSASGGPGNAHLGCNAFLSDDGGKTWRLGAVDAAPAGGRQGAAVYPNESTAAELPDGTLVFNTRDQGGPAPGSRGATRSTDGGETFTAPYAADPGLVGPVCQGALLAGEDLAGKPVLLASLPADPKERKKLQIRLSRDGGKTWLPGPVLTEGLAAYSDIVQLAPGRFLAVVEVDGYQGIRAMPFEVPGER